MKRILIIVAIANGFALVAAACLVVPIFHRIAVEQHQKSLLRTRESALHEDLFVMREAIDQFTEDNGAPPKSLDDLVRAGYLREIPEDPMAPAALWEVILCDANKGAGTAAGICEVHSRSGGKSPFEGTLYRVW